MVVIAIIETLLTAGACAALLALRSLPLRNNGWPTQGLCSAGLRFWCSCSAMAFTLRFVRTTRHRLHRHAFVAAHPMHSTHLSFASLFFSLSPFVDHLCPLCVDRRDECACFRSFLCVSSYAQACMTCDQHVCSFSLSFVQLCGASGTQALQDNEIRGGYLHQANVMCPARQERSLRVSWRIQRGGEGRVESDMCRLRSTPACVGRSTLPTFPSACCTPRVRVFRIDSHHTNIIRALLRLCLAGVPSCRFTRIYTIAVSAFSFGVYPTVRRPPFLSTSTCDCVSLSSAPLMPLCHPRCSVLNPPQRCLYAVTVLHDWRSLLLA